jgi:hypothetical protein
MMGWRHGNSKYRGVKVEIVIVGQGSGAWHCGNCLIRRNSADSRGAIQPAVMSSGGALYNSAPPWSGQLWLISDSRFIKVPAAIRQGFCDGFGKIAQHSLAAGLDFHCAAETG